MTDYSSISIHSSRNWCYDQWSALAKCDESICMQVARVITTPLLIIATVFAEILYFASRCISGDNPKPSVLEESRLKPEKKQSSQARARVVESRLKPAKVQFGEVRARVFDNSQTPKKVGEIHSIRLNLKGSQEPSLFTKSK